MADRDPTDLETKINKNYILPYNLATYLALAFPELKENEIHCLHYISYGYSNDRIAFIMNKSLSSIKGYVSSLLKIFDAESRLDLRSIYSARLNASIFFAQSQILDEIKKINLK
ncbi:helix-turn-helix transcriptional regulator (plasmid) [Photobacterium damselae subsp. damselae]